MHTGGKRRARFQRGRVSTKYQNRPGASVRRLVENLHPASCDIVMATGILSIAAGYEGMPALGVGLTYLNIAFLIALLAANVARLIWYRAAFVSDLRSFQRGPGFFTVVAGVAIVGSEILTILRQPGIALAAWIVSVVLWAGFNYAIFIEITINENKPRFEDGINGGWLISVVATQAVANLCAQISDRFVDPQPKLFLALALWLAGGMLYIWLIALIFYRFTFFRFRPESFLPPFWINMGAVAVSALTGAELISHAGNAAFLPGLLPFVKGLTILFWATATWWIPMLAVLAIWQHIIRNVNRPYNLLYWSAVFPLGMYTAATYELAQVMHMPFLMWIPRVFVYVALAGWVATFLAMIHSEFARGPESHRFGRHAYPE